MENRIVYKDKDVIIYNKKPGEDSEKIIFENMDARVLSRLDKPVSGLIPFAISKDGAKAEFKKKYRAVIVGKIEDKGTLVDLLYHDKRANKVYPVKKERNGVKSAMLHYEVLSYSEENDLSLVDIELDTGRTHQIRVQFASRKHPLVGDRKYGSRIKADAIALESYQLLYTNSKSSVEKLIKLPFPEGYPWDLFSSDLF